jgi:hypothetical protein
MSELETYRRRTREAAEALNALPLLGPGQPGPPDEKTGERWDRANVLGHVAEMLPFWTSQMRGVIGGGTEVGRGEAGQMRRRDGIESGRLAGEEELRQRVGAGVEGLLLLLDEMREEDLDRRARFLTQGSEREVDLRELLDTLLVGHLEEHVRQLRSLGTN